MIVKRKGWAPSWSVGKVGAPSAAGWGAGLHDMPGLPDGRPLMNGATAAAASADDWESGLIGRRGLAGAGSGVCSAPAAGHGPEARWLLKKPENASHVQANSTMGRQ